MTNINKQQLKLELKEMIIIECDKSEEFKASGISDDEALVGAEAKLELDSLDSLQLALAIQNTYKVRIEGTKDGRLAFASINALADYILEGSN